MRYELLSSRIMQSNLIFTGPVPMCQLYWAFASWFLGAFAEFPKTTNSMRHVCLSFCPVELLDSYWTDFRKTWYLSISRKSLEKIKVPLKCTFMIISPWILKVRNVLNKNCREIKPHIWCFSPPLKIIPFVRYCGRTCYSQTGDRWQYGACALRAAYLRLQTHTQNI